MTSLYVDLSYGLIIGVLKKDFTWASYDVFTESKNASIFHEKLYEVLSGHKIRPQDVEQVFYNAGPGSYTGIKLVESFSDIFCEDHLKSYSFYHFQVPGLVGISEGLWLNHAYKKEYLAVSWKGCEFVERLIPIKDFPHSLLKENKIFSFSEEELYPLQPLLERIKINITSTASLIKDHSSVFFSRVLKEKFKKEAYYYRPPEVEFNVS